MTECSDVVYQSPGLVIYTDNGQLVAEFSARFGEQFHESF